MKKHTEIESIIELDETEDQRTLGQRIADKVADFGGSWTFIISFFVFYSFGSRPMCFGFITKDLIRTLLFY